MLTCSSVLLKQLAKTKSQTDNLKSKSLYDMKQLKVSNFQFIYFTNRSQPSLQSSQIEA